MRIIAGQWRGRRLKAPNGESVRPTTDRAKEALFSILGPRVAGSVVLDLCCGAGGLGLEALSRGASRAVFVDVARASVAATRANLALCGAAAGSYSVEQGDAVKWFSHWPGPEGAPWLLLCDPPYPSRIAAAMIERVTSQRVPAGMWRAVVEYGAQSPDVAVAGPDWQVRRYGESHLAIYTPGSGPETGAAP